MEPFVYQIYDGIPVLYAQQWMHLFPHLVVGLSARAIAPDCLTSGQDLATFNYALAGNPRAVSNRQQLAKSLKLPFHTWTCAEQVHGIKTKRIQLSDIGQGRDYTSAPIPAVDALYTTEDDALLMAFFADCVPLYFYSPEVDIVGIAHAGWRGTVNGMGRQMVTKLVACGARASTLQVLIGPSIGPCCYEVDEPVLKLVHRSTEKHGQALTQVGGGWRLDLKVLNKEILQHVGLQVTNIAVSNYCTCCTSNLHSYRRDGARAGRMVGWICKRGSGRD